MSERAELERLVLKALGNPCAECARGIAALLALVHDRRGVTLAAHARGLSDRKKLERKLRRHGLGRLHRLKDRLRLLVVIWEWEQDSVCLAEQAYVADSDPSSLYRLVHRVAGLPWQETRGLGFAYWLGRFEAEVGVRVLCGDASCPRE